MTIKLSDESRKALADELCFVATKMGEAPDTASKLYFFSAAYGAVQRAVNSVNHPEPELVFVHFALNAAYNTINTRAQSMVHGVETPVSIPPGVMDRLQSSIEEIGVAIRKGGDTHPYLQTIANLAYSTTGNGYYLFLKGLVGI